MHSPTTGTAREDVWKQLFEMIIPKKFVIEQSVFIIDSSFSQENSQTGVSKEVDIAIIDETYTPYIFQYGRIKFIPIEAVAVAVECKSGNTDATAWCQRINDLKTSDQSIARIANMLATDGAFTQRSTRPIKILCTLDKGANKDLFDIVITAQTDSTILDIPFTDKFQKLGDIYQDLNFCKGAELTPQANEAIKKLEDKTVDNFEVGNNSLLSFNFQLNQILMLINNPLLFPHQAYVKMFNEKVQEEGK